MTPLLFMASSPAVVNLAWSPIYFFGNQPANHSPRRLWCCTTSVILINDYPITYSLIVIWELAKSNEHQYGVRPSLLFGTKRSNLFDQLFSIFFDGGRY